MAKIIKIFLVTFIIFIVLFILTYLLLIIKGEFIVRNRLERLTQRQVSIDTFILKPPLKIEIKNLNIQGLFKAEHIYVQPSLLAFLSGNLGFNELRISDCEITYERFPFAKGATGQAGSSGFLGVLPFDTSAVNFNLIIKHFNLSDCRVKVIDHTVGASGITLNVKDINFDLTDLYLPPRPEITTYKLKAKIPWQEGQEDGEIESEGWLNLHKKDMQVTFSIKSIDGLYLYPYYSQWVDLQNSRVERAKLNFSGNMHGLNNNVAAECHLELNDIVFKERQPEEQAQKEEKMTKTVLNMFKAMDKGKIVLDFTIHTAMDKPKFKMGAIKAAAEEKLINNRKSKQPIVGDVAVFPLRLLEGAVRASTDLSKAVIDGTFAIGNEVKKDVQASFRKEKKE